MLKVAICDDCPESIKRFESIVKQIPNRYIDYEVYFGSEDFLNNYEEGSIGYDMYILDIRMKYMDGIELAKRIRKSDMKALIVFLTRLTNYVYDVFEIVTFDYLIKPLTYEKLITLFNHACIYLDKTENFFSFCFRKNQFSLEYSCIKFIEKKGRKAFIYTMNETYQYNCTTLELWDQLDSSIFIHIHSSYIVNLQHLYKVDHKMAYLKTGEELNISRKYSKEVRRRYLECQREKT